MSASLEAHLSKHEKSDELSLAYVQIGAKGVEMVSRFIQNNIVCRKIDLTHCEITSEQLVKLARSLRNNTTLHQLCMANNNLGDGILGFEALRDVLIRNEGLTLIDFRNNNLTPAHIELIAEILLDSRTKITHLLLSGNNFGEDAGKTLLKALQSHSNRTILDIQLSDCGISTNTLHKIAGCVKENWREEETKKLARQKTNQAITEAPDPSDEPASIPRTLAEQIRSAENPPPPTDSEEGWRRRLLTRLSTTDDADEQSLLKEVDRFVSRLRTKIKADRKEAEVTEGLAAEKMSGKREEELAQNIEHLEAVQDRDIITFVTYFFLDGCTKAAKFD